MKEIKFRAWDKENKEIHQVLEIRWIEDDVTYKTKQIFAVLYWSYEQGQTIELRDGEYELMQYTGLKDKNGKEIYEGDIIEAFYYYDEEEDKKVPENRTVFEVKGKIDKGRQFCGFDLFPSEFEYIKVIGNIYENPELLKK